MNYSSLPYRYKATLSNQNCILLTSYVGEYIFLTKKEFQQLENGELIDNPETLVKLLSRQFICEAEKGPFLEGLISQQATRKFLVSEDPSLHIVVLTLRCDHKCHYCQVTPRKADDLGYDMTEEDASSVLERVFESNADTVTIEFQGGEAGLNFDLLKFIVDGANEKAVQLCRKVRFVITSTLHCLTVEMLEYCSDNKIELSTSLDGPSFIHNKNRPNLNGDSYERTVQSIKLAQEICGRDSVSALMTVTRHSLPYAKEIVQTYIDLGLETISARPISPLGFAKKSMKKLGYSVEQFLKFYKELLDHLIAINLSGIVLEETYASMLLTRILTPFPTGYVDLQSPAAAGSSVLVYNYDGLVYPSDEARMLAEMGDSRFRMGSIKETLSTLRQSSALKIINEHGCAEKTRVCENCAFVPYCGSDPVMNVAENGTPELQHGDSDFCKRHMQLFELFFGYIERNDEDAMKVFLSWITKKNVSEIRKVGYMG